MNGWRHIDIIRRTLRMMKYTSGINGSDVTFQEHSFLFKKLHNRIKKCQRKMYSRRLDLVTCLLIPSPSPWPLNLSRVLWRPTVTLYYTPIPPDGDSTQQPPCGSFGVQNPKISPDGSQPFRLIFRGPICHRCAATVPLELQ